MLAPYHMQCVQPVQLHMPWAAHNAWGGPSMAQGSGLQAACGTLGITLMLSSVPGLVHRSCASSRAGMLCAARGWDPVLQLLNRGSVLVHPEDWLSDSRLALRVR